MRTLAVILLLLSSNAHALDCNFKNYARVPTSKVVLCELQVLRQQNAELARLILQQKSDRENRLKAAARYEQCNKTCDFDGNDDLAVQLRRSCWEKCDAIRPAGMGGEC